MDGYELYDGRYIQEYTGASAADALSSPAIGPVPAGKVWTILNASYNPSAAETRVVYFYVISRAGTWLAVTWPTSVAASNVQLIPALTMGMELKLFPGEELRCHRDVATAGSTMVIYGKWISADLPYYRYVDPLAPVVKQTQRRGESYRMGSLSIGGPASSGGGREGGRGGGREPEPI